MIRVMVVDDQTLVRQGICSLLRLASNIRIVAEAGNGDEALQCLMKNEIDVLLLDLRMPVRDGLGTLRALREQGKAIPTIILTTFDDDELVMQSIEAGARGYLLKDVSYETLVHAIETVHGGERLHQPVVTDSVRMANAQDTQQMPAATETLSTREREVLRLMAAGYSNKEIGRALDLAEGTIKNHVSVILAKLNVRDRTRAVMKAIQAKWI